MNSVIVTPRLLGPSPDDEMGRSVYYFARLLRDNGHYVSIIFTGPIEKPQEQWLHLYHAHNIPIQYIQTTPPDVFAPTYYAFMRCSQAVMAKIPADTDIVYFQDWQANGFHYIRSRRFCADLKPVSVTVLHGGTDWLTDAMQQFPTDVYEGAAISFGERYVARYSDFVVSFSQYMIDWVSDQGWLLPPADRIHVLGRLLLRDVNDPKQTEAVVEPADQFKRLVFWGRLEPRKGFELFVDALLYLGKNRQDNCLGQLDEVLYIGGEGTHKYDTAAVAAQMLNAIVPSVNWLALDLESARRYLTEHVLDTFVVIPSLSDNFPYTVLEASLIPGLNFICSRVDGITEMLGSSDSEPYFDAYVRPLAAKIEMWLLRGPQERRILAEYNWESANRRWLAFHDEVCPR